MAPPDKRKEVEAALPGTVLQLVDKTGLAESTVRRMLRRLRDDDKAHISKRLRNVGGSTPLWVAGPGEDAPPLKPYTAAQYCRRFRKRVRKAIKDAEAGRKPDPRYLRHVARVQTDKIAKVGDPFINAFFGRTAA